MVQWTNHRLQETSDIMTVLHSMRYALQRVLEKLPSKIIVVNSLEVLRIWIWGGFSSDSGSGKSGIAAPPAVSQLAETLRANF